MTKPVWAMDRFFEWVLPTQAALATFAPMLASNARVCALPVLFCFGLALLGFFGASGVAQISCYVLATAGVVASAWLWGWASAAQRCLSFEVRLFKHHYVQACVHASIFVYWGCYWDQVWLHAPLIAAQLLFAFAFDLLLQLFRRGHVLLGMGPVPIVFSTNLFLWFRADWFYLQFAIIAMGLLAKEFLRWQRAGARVHIFNPSSFPLAVASWVLILTGLSGYTWGHEISLSQFWPPHMYLFLFLVALPGQYFFGVTLMTLSAAVTTYGVGLLYYVATGTYFFYDSYIPIASFLGMNLLFTDPSTSPRSDTGRIFYGVLYGLSVVGLDAMGFSYYDKLLQVPLLNLLVRRIDHWAQGPWLGRLPQLMPGLQGRRRHLAYMGIWALVFAGMSAVQGVGDEHPGQYIPFWSRACLAGKQRACARLVQLEQAYCAGGSAWACGELGIHGQSAGDDEGALSVLDIACAQGHSPACDNAERLRARKLPLAHALPAPDDYPVILMGSKGHPLSGQTPDALAARACRQGWVHACVL